VFSWIYSQHELFCHWVQIWKYQTLDLVSLPAYWLHEEVCNYETEPIYVLWKQPCSPARENLGKGKNISVRCISGPWINEIMDFLTCENQGAYSPGRLRFNGWLPYLPWLNMMNIHGPLVSIGWLLYFSITQVKGDQVIRLTSLQAWPLSSEQTPYMPICQLFWSSAGVFGDLLQWVLYWFLFLLLRSIWEIIP
jgi:hypothetical protein